MTSEDPARGDGTADPLVGRLRAAGSVFAEDEAAVLRGTGRAGADLEALVGRRLAGEPLEHVVGHVDFCGVRLRAASGTFVPRQRTALLVDEACRRLAAAPRPLLVDLCCGVGAVAAAVAARVPGVRVHASDVDARAAACAEVNLAGVPGARVAVGDLDEPLPPSLAGRVDVLAAHVPYVPTAALGLLPPEARDHEPRTALDGGADGLDLLRRVAGLAPRWLAPGGALLCEVADGQLRAAGQAYAAAGLVAEERRDDERGALVLVGTRVAAGVVRRRAG